MTREQLREALEAELRWVAVHATPANIVGECVDRVLRIIDAWDNGHMPEPLR